MSSQPRRFNQPRPTERGIQSNIRQQPSRNEAFRPLPHPTGQPPYHLSLDQVLPPENMAAIRNAGRLLFHVAGDTRGGEAPQTQQILGMGLEEQFKLPDITPRPGFFFHPGGVGYFL